LDGLFVYPETERVFHGKESSHVVYSRLASNRFSFNLQQLFYDRSLVRTSEIQRVTPGLGHPCELVAGFAGIRLASTGEPFGLR
jgi:hypothetical protein